MPLFDTCIITASNEGQAEVFRTLLSKRVDQGLYPREIDFRVVADPPGGRVGSGGGTLWALIQYLGKDSLSLADVGRRKILMIHAGGEARRLPVYGPEGKLFAPVPAASSSILPPIVLDLELSLFFKYPWRDGELLVASGDVIIDFNTEALDLPEGPICGFAAPAPFERGARHGVFAFDAQTGLVSDYHQKASADFLAQKARIEGVEACAVDLGIVSFRGSGLEALLSLAAAQVDGQPLRKSLAAGQLSFDIYLDFLVASLGSLDEASYLARMAGQSGAAESAQRLVYQAFHGCGLSGVLVKQSSFIHFGSLDEYPAACLELRAKDILPFYGFAHEELVPEAHERFIRFNCIETDIEDGSGFVYTENCSDSSVRGEGDNLFSGLRGLRLAERIPRGFCIDERRISGDAKAASVRLVYHRDDSFKIATSVTSLRFCGKPLGEWLSERHLSLADVVRPHAGHKVDPYALAVFTIITDAEFVTGYWRLPVDTEAWKQRFLGSPRLSYSLVNAATSAVLRDEERAQARKSELTRSIERGGFFAISGRDFRTLVQAGLGTETLVERHRGTDDPLLKIYRGTLLRSAGVEGLGEERGLEVRFAPHRSKPGLSISVKLDQIVWARSPVRLDLAGGWTDTPPYTNRYGGSVVNVAVDLNGQSPIQVFVRRSEDCVIRVHSIDLGLTETIRDTNNLRAYRNLASPFALPRAALVLIGVGSGLPDGAPLEALLMAMGGGLEITLLCAVPKGSGLGTSSVLAGTILAALERFFGMAGPKEELFLKVLEVEQMLTTGGGWQDQIGGLVGGVKYIEARPGLKPRAVIHQLDPWLFEDPESTGRMTLFYSGITRLAKGLLQDVVQRVNGMERAFLFTHSRIGELAQEARKAISFRDVDRLGWVIAESFRENKLIHESTTNAEMEKMITETAAGRIGVKLLGAGGGGFALFVSRDVESALALRSLLKGKYEDERARLVDFSLNKKGLEVTVS